MHAQDGVPTPIGRLAGLLRPHRRALALAAGFTTGACLLNLPIPLLTRAVIECAESAGPTINLILLGLGLLAVSAAQAAIGWANAVTLGRIGWHVARDLRVRLYDRLHRLPLAYFDRTPAGGLIARLTDDVSAVQALVTAQAVAVLTDLGTAAVVAGYMAAHWPRLLLAAGMFVPLYLVVFRRFAGRIRTGTDEVRTRLDTIFGHLKEKIDGIQVVKVHGREAAEAEEFAGRIAAAHDPRLRVGRLGVALSALVTTTGGTGAALVFAVGALDVAAGRMSAGELVSAAALAALLFGPLGRLADLAGLFQQSAASLARLGQILDAETAVEVPAGLVALGRVRGRVEFDRVGFAYAPGRSAVRDVSFQAEPGMTVALVGPTGCGKSTLLNFLLRFYDPARGEVRIDGVPTSRIRPADLRRQVAVVPQDAVVFSATLADNIRYGCPDAPDERVVAAARAARVDEFAARLPDGYGTVVGEGGQRLSQGERQRVAIARAFCQDPAIVLLDEATSSLDPVNEARVQAGLRELFRGRTAIVVAHRLATVADADLIVVLDRGRVVQIGTHQELLAEPDGLYHRLWTRQGGSVNDERDPVPTEQLLVAA